MKIIVVENDIELGTFLKVELEKQGFSVDTLEGDEGVKRLRIHHSNYDLAILGNLAGKQGHEICAEIRELGIATPILVLAENDADETKITAIEVGADDCVAKPFLIREIIARAHAILRRPKAILPTTLKVNDLELKLDCRTVLKSGKLIHLTLKEFNILEFLMRTPNKVVIRDNLLDKIWDFNFKGFSNVIDVHINNLRKKLADRRTKQTQSTMIETVRGVGYKLTA